VNTFFKTFLVATLLAGNVLGAGLAETPKSLAAKPAPRSLSVFVVPSNVHEGRDPFFPESGRVYEANAPSGRKVEATSLVLKGFSGTPGHRYVIINNHTFAVGDEGDVLTASGRAHIRCLEIRSDAVVVEINGQRHTIPY
jgi:hypothetical protein